MPERIQSFWDWLQSTSGQAAIAGLAGAAVNAVFEWTGIWAASRKIFVGATCAYFLGPIGDPILEWAFVKVAVPAESAASVGGFIMGIGGLFIVEAIVAGFRIRLNGKHGGIG